MGVSGLALCILHALVRSRTLVQPRSLKRTICFEHFPVGGSGLAPCILHTRIISINKTPSDVGVFVIDNI